MSTRIALVWFCTLTLFACASAPGRQVTASSAQGAAPSQQQIERAYASFAEAVKARDLEAVMALLTADIEWRMVDGSVQHRAEVQALMKDYLATRAEGPYYFEIGSLRSEGGQTVAEVVLHDGDTLDRWTDTWTASEGALKNRLGIQHR